MNAFQDYDWKLQISELKMAPCLLFKNHVADRHLIEIKRDTFHSFNSWPVYGGRCCLDNMHFDQKSRHHSKRLNRLMFWRIELYKNWKLQIKFSSETFWSHFSIFVDFSINVSVWADRGRRITIIQRNEGNMGAWFFSQLFISST